MKVINEKLRVGDQIKPLIDEFTKKRPLYEVVTAPSFCTKQGMEHLLSVKVKILANPSISCENDYVGLEKEIILWSGETTMVYNR